MPEDVSIGGFDDDVEVDTGALVVRRTLVHLSPLKVTMEAVAMTESSKLNGPSDFLQIEPQR